MAKKSFRWWIDAVIAVLSAIAGVITGTSLCVCVTAMV